MGGGPGVTGGIGAGGIGAGGIGATTGGLGSTGSFDRAGIDHFSNAGRHRRLGYVGFWYVGDGSVRGLQAGCQQTGPGTGGLDSSGGLSAGGLGTGFGREYESDPWRGSDCRDCHPQAPKLHSRNTSSKNITTNGNSSTTLLQTKCRLALCLAERHRISMARVRRTELAASREAG